MTLLVSFLVVDADKDEGCCEANDSKCGTSVGFTVVALSLGVGLSEREADFECISDGLDEVTSAVDHGTDLVLTDGLQQVFHLLNQHFVLRVVLIDHALEGLGDVVSLLLHVANPLVDCFLTWGSEAEIDILV